MELDDVGGCVASLLESNGMGPVSKSTQEAGLGAVQAERGRVADVGAKPRCTTSQERRVSGVHRKSEIHRKDGAGVLWGGAVGGAGDARSVGRGDPYGERKARSLSRTAGSMHSSGMMSAIRMEWAFGSESVQCKVRNMRAAPVPGWTAWQIE